MRGAAIPWATAITALVAIYGAGLSTITFFEQRDEARNQLLLSTKPHLDFQIGNDPDELPVGIAIQNAGPGPADIRSVTFYVDRKSVTDAEEAGNTYGKLSDSELDYEIFDRDDTLAVGETAWLIRYRKPKGEKINRKNLERFADFVDQNLAIDVKFCSIIREDLCWTKCSTEGRCR